LTCGGWTAIPVTAEATRSRARAAAIDVDVAVDGAGVSGSSAGLLGVVMIGDVSGILKPLVMIGGASVRRERVGASFDRDGSRAAFVIGCRTVDVIDIDSRTLIRACQDE